jgi:hypothetical protein
MKEDLISYLKIFAGLMLTSPIFFCTFYVDLGLESAIIITTTMYFVAMCIAIPMFNYLQYGTFSIKVSDEDREDPYGIKRESELFKKSRDEYYRNSNIYKSKLF